MAAGSIQFYSSFINDTLLKVHDLDTDAVIALLTSSSYTPSLAHDELADITNEIASNSTTDYARVTLTGVSITGGVMTCDDIDFGTVTIANFKYLVLFNDDTANDRLIGYVDLDTGGSLSRSNQSLIITPSGSGLITVEQAP